MTQYLVSVTFGRKYVRKVVGRTDPRARLVDIIIDARRLDPLRAHDPEASQASPCTGFELLGTLEPHLFTEYPELGAEVV